MKKMIFVCIALFACLPSAYALDIQFEDTELTAKASVYAQKFVDDFSEEMPNFSIFINTQNGHLKIFGSHEEYGLYYDNGFYMKDLSLKNPKMCQWGEYYKNNYEERKNAFLNSCVFYGDWWFPEGSYNLGFNDDWVLYYSSFKLSYLGSSDENFTYKVDNKKMNEKSVIPVYKDYNDFKWLNKPLKNIDVFSLFSFFIIALVSIFVLIIVIKKTYFFFISNIKRV